MALTRKMLKAMGIEDEKIDQIIEAHTETVDALKEAAEKNSDAVKNAEALQKKVDELTSDLDAAKKDGWKDKHDSVKKEFDAYKAAQDAKETRAAKEKAVRAYLESKNIKDGNLTIAMRGLSAEIDAAELDGDNLKDTKVFDDLIAGEYAGLVTTTTERGAPPPANPPKNTGGKMSKKEIMAIKDYDERVAAIEAHRELFVSK